MKLARFIIFSASVLSALTGCITDDYDLSKKMDIEVSFALDGITLGGSNSADVPLSQVIELHENGQLIVDADGNYMFYKVGDDMEPTKIAIEGGALEQHDDQNFEQHLKEGIQGNIPELPQYRFGYPLEFTKVMEIDYKPDTQGKSIRDISYIKTPMAIAITTRASELTRMTDNVDITYEIPSFYELVDPSELKTTFYTWEDTHVDSIHIVGVNLKATNLREGEEIGFNSKTGKIIMKGKVTAHGKLTVDIPEFNAAQDPSIFINLSVGTMGVTEVTGRFNETKNVDIKPITFDDLPEFIRDDEVVIDVENPIVAISIDNEVPADVIMNAQMISIKDGKRVSVLSVGDDYGTDPIIFHGAKFGESEAKRTNIWVSRIPIAVPDSVEKNIVVSDMMKLIERVPDRVEVEAYARTDSSKSVTLGLAQEYIATPYYELAAPLKMGPKMKIVYKKEIEDLKENLEKTNLGSLVFTADVANNIPLDLSVEIIPLDDKGKEISGIKIITPEKIPANTSMPISFSIINDDSNAMSKIDRIRVKASAESSEKLAGNVLNKNQNLHIQNARISLKGGTIKL